VLTGVRNGCGEDLLVELVVVLFFVGLGNNIPGLVIAVVAFILFLRQRVRFDKAFAYCCFLLAGTAVAKLQWVIATGQSGELLRWETGFAELSVGGLSMLALIASLRILKVELLLVVLFVLTIVLGVLQFNDVPNQFVNWYARFFALTAIATPLWVLAQSWDRSNSP